MLKYFSKMSAVNFLPEWSNDFDEPAGYVQLFSLDDIIRFQAISEGAQTARAVIENTQTGDTVSVNGTDTGIAWDVYSVMDFDLTGSIEDPGLYRITIKQSLFDIAETYIRVEDPGAACLENTVRIRYTNRINDFDTVFTDHAGVQKYFDFRVEGGFLYKDIKFNVSSEVFRDQRYTGTQLSALPYRVKTFTAGTGCGVPYWVGEKLNLVFSCSDVTINDVQHVRSEGAVPELNELKELYPRYVYRLNVEETDNYKWPFRYDTGNIFMMTLDVAAGKLQNRLPFNTNVDLTIDWGDGVTETTKTNYPQHVYAAPGIYTVVIIGSASKMTRINMSTNIWDVNFGSNIISVDMWGDLGITDAVNGFNNCTGLTYINPNSGNFFRNTATANSMFYSCKKLQNIFTSFDAPVLTKALGMFSVCESISEIPVTFFRKCPNITDIDSCFTGCKNVTEVPRNLLATNVKVQYVNHLFTGCTALTNAIDCRTNKQIIGFVSMYAQCASLTDVPDYCFAGIAATSFSAVFQDCTSLRVIPENVFSNCTAAATFSYAFYGCTSLTSVPENIFASCTPVTDFSYAFYGCTSLVSLPAYLFRYNTQVTTFRYAFHGCSALTAVPSNFLRFNTRALDMTLMFSSCSSLVSIPSDIFSYVTNTEQASVESVFSSTAITATDPGWFRPLTNITSLDAVFYNCKNLISAHPQTFTYNTKVKNINHLFYGCTGLTDIPATIISTLALVETCRFAFSNTGITFIPETLFDGCPLLADVQYVFNGCGSLTSLPAHLFAGNPLITSFNSAFGRGAYQASLTGETPVDANGLKLWQRAGTPGYPDSITGAACFKYNTALSDYADIPANWRT
jgi:PKD repeat protein